ncbi:MAG: hypothetical protein WCI92_02875 [Bacteroidota bacterium]
MDTTELKKSFHLLIDSIDNENLLLDFYDLLKRRTKVKDGRLWDKLDYEEQKELLNAVEESKSEKNLISSDELKKKHKKWL